MKNNHIILIAVLLVLGIAYWNTLDASNETMNEQAQAQESLKPWQYRPLEIEDPELASILNVWMRKYEFRLPDGWYGIRAWVEEQTADETKPRTILELGRTQKYLSQTDMLVSLPTKSNPNACLIIAGSKFPQANIELVLETKNREMSSTKVDLSPQIKTFAAKTPLVLEAIEFFKIGQHTGTTPDRTVRLCIQFDPTPDPNAEKLK